MRGVADKPGLSAEQLGAYFALTEVGSLLQHAVEQQLRRIGGVSAVQFQILARLANTPGGRMRMTDIADGVVYSRSGLTYQAGLLERAGYISRAPASDDERGVVVTITAAGRDLVERILPDHAALVRELLIDPLDGPDLAVLTDTLTRVRDHMRAAPPRSATARRARRPS